MTHINRVGLVCVSVCVKQKLRGSNAGDLS
jgi:hypothetical protein